MPSTRSNKKPQHKVTKRSRPTTKAATNSKAQLPKMADADPSGPVYFWRESEPLGGYLSQWYPCAFIDDADPTIIYPTAEQQVLPLSVPS